MQTIAMRVFISCISILIGTGMQAFLYCAMSFNEEFLNWEWGICWFFQALWFIALFSIGFIIDEKSLYK
jgi:hypothetical protein